LESRMYDDTARFQDKHWYLIGMREIVFELFGRERTSPSLQILDLGCGTGQYLPGLSRLGQVVGLDRAPEALALSSRHGGPHSLLIRGDARELPLQSRSFDLVWASSILEHLPEDVSGLQEAVRVLKPEGRMVILVPAHHFLWGHHDDLAHHLRRYSREELENLCRKCGLRIVRSTHYGATPLPPAYLVRKFKNILGRFYPRMREVSDFRLASFPGLNPLFLSILRLEKLGLSRLNLPFGLMLYALVEKDFDGRKR